MKYFNLKTSYGIETVDCLNQFDFIYYKDYRKELIRLLNEYRLCGMNVYISQRATKDFYKK
jgi:hypothetical protein